MSACWCQKKFQVVQSVISISPVLFCHLPDARRPGPDAARHKAIVASDMKIVLASSSRYRRELLARLQIPFSAVNPGIEEAALAGESPEATATRLSAAQAPGGAGEPPHAA